MGPSLMKPNTRTRHIILERSLMFLPFIFLLLSDIFFQNCGINKESFLSSIMYEKKTAIGKPDFFSKIKKIPAFLRAFFQSFFEGQLFSECFLIPPHKEMKLRSRFPE